MENLTKEKVQEIIVSVIEKSFGPIENIKEAEDVYIMPSLESSENFDEEVLTDELNTIFERTDISVDHCDSIRDIIHNNFKF